MVEDTELPSTTNFKTSVNDISGREYLIGPIKVDILLLSNLHEKKIFQKC